MQPPDPNQPGQPFDPQQPAPGYGQPGQSEQPGQSAPEGSQAPLPPGIPDYNQPLPPQSYPQGYAPQAYPPQAYPPQGSAPQGGYPAGYRPGPPTVRFDALNEAWALFQAQMGNWIGAILILGAIIYGISFVMGLVLGVSGMGLGSLGKTTPNWGPFVGGRIVMQFVTMAVQFVLTGGLYRMATKQVRGYQISISDMFDIGDVIGPLIGASFLVVLCMYAGLICCIVPGLIVNGLLMFTIPLVVDRKLGAMDALTTSWETLKPHLWPATGFYLVMSIIAGLGIIACCVGVLFTAPLLPLSVAVIYRDFFITPTPDQPLPTSTHAGDGPPIPDPHA